MSLGTTLTFAATFLIGAATIAPAVSAQQRPDLSGRWVLDSAQTGDPSAKLALFGGGLRPDRPALDSAAADPYSGRPRPGSGVAPGRQPTQGDRERMQRSRQAMEPLLQGPAMYEIAQSGDTIAFHPLRVEEVLLSIPINGKTWKVTTPSGTLEAKAKWGRESLLLERKLPDDIKVREDFSLSMDRSRLLVDTRVDGGYGQVVDFRRVYVREGR